MDSEKKLKRVVSNDTPAKILVNVSRYEDPYFMIVSIIVACKYKASPGAENGFHTSIAEFFVIKALYCIENSVSWLSIGKMAFPVPSRIVPADRSSAPFFIPLLQGVI